MTNLAPTFGNMLGFIIPLVFVSTQETIDYDQQRGNMFINLLFQACFSLLMFLLTVVLWRTSIRFIDYTPAAVRGDQPKPEPVNLFYDRDEGRIDTTYSQIVYILKRADIRPLVIIYSVTVGLVMTISST